MHQPIKNFSELTAIDTRGKLRAELKLKFHGHTVSKVTLNEYEIDTDGHVTIPLGLFTDVTLVIDLISFTEGTSGIEIEYFGINGYEVLPKYKHLALRETAYIDKLGRWAFHIPSPFYAWYHEISGQGWIA